MITESINITVGSINLVGWIEGHTYESDTGATYYSGAEVPSLEDAMDCLANPRAFPLYATPEDIKAEAQRRILAIAPAWKQSNLIASVLELTRDHGSPPEAWDAQKQETN